MDTNTTRRRAKSIHEAVEAACVEYLNRHGRTWLRMTIEDRHRVVTSALATLPTAAAPVWWSQFSLYDVLKPKKASS